MKTFKCNISVRLTVLLLIFFGSCSFSGLSAQNSDIIPSELIVFFSQGVSQDYIQSTINSYGIKFVDIYNECEYSRILSYRECTQDELKNFFAIFSVPTGYAQDWVSILNKEKLVKNARLLTEQDVARKVDLTASLESNFSFSNQRPPPSQKLAINIVVISIKKRVSEFLKNYQKGIAEVQEYEIGEHFIRFLIRYKKGVITKNKDWREILTLTVIVVPGSDNVDLYQMIEGTYEVDAKTISGRVTSTSFHDMEYNSEYMRSLDEYLKTLSTSLKHYLQSVA